MNTLDIVVSVPLFAFIAWWLWTFRKPASPTQGNPPIDAGGW